jgi:hypothetical protein
MTIEQVSYDFRDMARRKIRNLAARVCWELNDNITRARVQGMCEAWLDDITNDYNYEILCDEINNPPEVIDRCEIRVDLIYRRHINLGKWYEEHIPVSSFTIGTDGVEYKG